jgi:hypothetical protein
MPLDPEPNPEGNVILLPDGRCRKLNEGADVEAGTPRYMPHFLSCPDGRKWKGKKRGQAQQQTIEGLERDG